MTTHYDSMIIGAGQAGPSLAGRLDQAGHSVAFIERQKVGGTCVNYGCTPTKTLIASARVARMARRAGDFGIDIDGAVGVDMPAVHERMEAVVGQSRDGLLESIEGMHRVTFIPAHARFVGERRVEAGGEELSADRVFLNVGARASIPPVDGIEDVDVMTNHDLLKLQTVPEHLVVIGGSYLGLEFAQMFRRFGSEVTVVERKPRLVAREDPEISEAVRRVLENEGIDVRLEVGSTALAPDRGVTVSLGDGTELTGSHVLMATGRRPNTDNLNLEAAGIETDDRGFVDVDDRLRTTADGVWALGTRVRLGLQAAAVLRIAEPDEHCCAES